MRIPFRLYTLVALLFSTATLGLRADMTPYIGQWSVDIPATLEAGKQSPKYNAAEDEKMKPMITSILGSMSMTIDKERLTLARGSGSQTLPYTFKSTTEGVTAVSVQVADKSFEFSFSMDGNKRMHFKSSASHDMDYFVWKAGMEGVRNVSVKPAKPAPTINGNLRLIQQGADQYCLEMAATSVSYETLAKGGYFKALEIVNGENYATAVIDVAGGSVSVKDKDGVSYNYKK